MAISEFECDNCGAHTEEDWSDRAVVLDTAFGGIGTTSVRVRVLTTGRGGLDLCRDCFLKAMNELMGIVAARRLD